MDERLEPADLQGVMDPVEVTRDVVVLVVQDQAQNVERRMLLSWPEVTGLINDDAERWARLTGRGRLVPVRNERPAHDSVQRG